MTDVNPVPYPNRIPWANDEFVPEHVWMYGKGPGERLVVFLHGFAATTLDYEGLLHVVRGVKRADLYAPDYGSGGLLASDHPHSVTTDLAGRFNKFVAGYKEVHFVAHSMGTAFLREAFVKGLGTAESPTPLRALLERDAVRMTFLASTSRGYTPRGFWQTLRLGLLRRWYWLTLLLLGFGFAPFPTGTLYGLSVPDGITLLVASGAAAGVALIASLLANRRGEVGPMAAGAMGVCLAAPYLGANPGWAWPATLLVLLGLALYPMRTGLLLEHLLYGSSWLTGVRLRWIRTFSPTSGLRPPPVVHLFGEEDRLVGDEDHVELHHFDRTVELAIRGVAHGDFQISQLQLEREPALAAQRASRPSRRDQFMPPLLEAVRRAVGDDAPKRLRDLVESGRPAVRASTAREAVPPPYRVVEPITVRRRVARGIMSGVESETPEHVVFLVHGIRDFAGWQDALAAKFRAVAEERGLRLIEPVQVRYGYFSAFQFLLSGERERATRAFLDLYTQTRARYPGAACHAAAHSNGTFVVANALLHHEFIELDRLYLAGSVLTRDFRWDEVGPNRGDSAGGRRGAVNRVRSDRAAQDWPVGVLCWVLAGLGRLPLLRNFYGALGAGGVHGFKRLDDAQGNQLVFENAYLPGGHGEALSPKYHREVADFVLTGEPVKTAQPLATRADERFLRWVLVGAAVGAAAVAVAFVAPAMFGPACAGWGVTVGGLTMLLVIRVGIEV